VEELPVIDVAPLVGGVGDTRAVASAIDAACRTHGFFYIRGHGVPEDLQQRLVQASQTFFALPEAQKSAIAMDEGGRAWRGWFPFEGELTSGRPDRKEGIYFGAELGTDDARVRAGTPLHGPNLFPRALPELRVAVLDYLDAMTSLGHAVLRGVALGLDLDAGWFHTHLTADPLVLFRIFRYPPEADVEAPNWGVAEHTDYGLLTILRQDDLGGLQVHAPSGWIDAPPLPGSFVVNTGELLELASGGYLRATVHRVVAPPPGVERLSIAFFLAASLDARVPALVLPPELAERARGVTADPANPLFRDVGLNTLKGRIRSHPDVAARHFKDLA
jgi:isopenicillin N synthase-like dioxygenase